MRFGGESSPHPPTLPPRTHPHHREMFQNDARRRVAHISRSLFSYVTCTQIANIPTAHDPHIAYEWTSHFFVIAFMIALLASYASLHVMGGGYRAGIQTL